MPAWKMQLILLLIALACTTQALPEGYYHQQAEYHSSSSSFRNNELAHKKDDEGFYSEHGDLEGRTKPKVNTYGEHSEYTNPKLKNQQSAGYQGVDDSLYGSSYNQDSLASHLGRNYRVDGSGSSAYGFGAGGSQTSYGVASNLQDLTQRLQQDLSRQLQSAVSEQRRESASYSRSSSSTSTQMQQDLRDLEEELKTNLTRKLQEALYQKYGQQSIRGPYSYSLTTGVNPNPTANYNTDELTNLKSQLENNLLRELQQEVRTQYQRTSSYSGGSSYSNNRDYNNRETLPLSANTNDQYNRDVESINPYGNSRPTQGIKTTSSGSRNQFNTFQSNYDRNYEEETTSSISITELANKVQDALSLQIDDILDEEHKRNLALIQQRRLPKYTETFEFLKSTLKSNLTTFLNDEIRKTYGPQIQEGASSYSVLPNGNRKNRPNFRLEDLQTLKQQMEDNLVEKLSYGIRQQESMNAQQQTTATNSRPYRPTDYNTGVDNTRYNDEYSQNSYSSRAHSSNSNYRPIYTQTQPTAPISSGSQTNTGTYGYPRVQNNRGYETNPDSEVELHNIQQTLQDDLSRQLQSAIRETKNEFRSYSSSSSSGNYATPSPANYQATLEELTEELKRNLTQKLQQRLNYGGQRTASGSSYSYSASAGSAQSGNYNSQQVEDLARQLQNNLVKQLQDGLYQNMYSQYSSSSYSASSSSGAGHQRPAYTKTGSYRSADAANYFGGQSQRYGGASYGLSHSNLGVVGEDCEYQNDDGHATRHRRHLNEQYDDLVQQKQVDDFAGQVQELEDLSDLEQQNEYDLIPKVLPLNHLNEVVPKQEKVVRQEPVEEFGNIQVGSQKTNAESLETKDDSSVQQTQELEQPSFSKLDQQALEPLIDLRNDGVQFQQTGTLPVADNLELTQQHEEENFSNLQEPQLTHQTNIRNAHQYPEESSNQHGGNFEPESWQMNDAYVSPYFRQRPPTPLTHHNDLDTQQVEEFPAYNKPSRIETLEPLDTDLSQHSENLVPESVSFVQTQYKPQQTVIDQRLEDLSQQNKDTTFGEHDNDFGNTQQLEDLNLQAVQRDEDLTQQTETDNFGTFQLGGNPPLPHNYRQPRTEFDDLTQHVDEDLTQQTETENIGYVQSPYHHQTADLTQQTETENLHSYQHHPHSREAENLNQQLEDFRHTEYNPYYPLHYGSQNKPSPLYSGQQPQVGDLTQQSEYSQHNDGLTQELESDQYSDNYGRQSNPPSVYTHVTQPDVGQLTEVPEPTEPKNTYNAQPVDEPVVQKSFWSKLGNKIGGAYTSVKNQAIKLKDKIF